MRQTHWSVPKAKDILHTNSLFDCLLAQITDFFLNFIAGKLFEDSTSARLAGFGQRHISFISYVTSYLPNAIPKLTKPAKASREEDFQRIHHGHIPKFSLDVQVHC
jgi:hypothetical protein